MIMSEIQHYVLIDTAQALTFSERNTSCVEVRNVWVFSAFHLVECTTAWEAEEMHFKAQCWFKQPNCAGALTHLSQPL